MFGGRGNRHMYYLTGLPGWMRFGFSPGWGTLPPGAQYLMTGSWPTWQANWAWQNMPQVQAGQFLPFDPYGVSQLTKEQELQLLKQQAEALKAQLEQIEKRVQELES
ncbi:MAG: hypothetical protein DRP68_06515 [Candidatus Omnitrophota bacterium]|nr:MAG: hypothetical protein DRP68_06515 [Candidatus Omnitrophota bacterium]